MTMPAPAQRTFPCPHCATPLGISAARSGAAVRCPACRASLEVPRDDVPLPDPPAGEQAGAAVRPQPPLATDNEEEVFKLSTRKREAEEMDLTPMVDVTFLLLIFFMITASFSIQKTLRTPLPEPDPEGVSQQLITEEELEREAVVVRLEAEDAVYVDDVLVPELADLPDAVADALAGGPTARAELVIEAAEEARHEAVVAAYDAAAGLNVERIRLAVPAGD